MFAIAGLPMFLMVLVFVTFVTLVVLHGKRQRRLWALWTQARNWQFIERWPAVVKHFKGGPFGTGSSRQASFGFQGVFDGLPASGFHYQYTTGSGKESTTHHFQVLRVVVPGARFPLLSLRRENWATRTFVKDIQFEDAAFNRSWDVNGSNRRFAHDVIHQRIMVFLQSGEMPALQSIWFERDSVLLSVPGSLRPEDIDRHLRVITRLVSLLPPYLLQEVGSVGRLGITWNGPGISAEEQQRRMRELEGNRGKS